MRRAAVWIEPGATRDHLRFGVAQARGSNDPVENVNDVRVTSCEVPSRGRHVSDHVMWLASGSAWGKPVAAVNFGYGEAPTGLVTRSGPEPLAAGCYVISISGTGVSASEQFEVRTDGTVQSKSTKLADVEVRNRAS
jgi:hypothetical protein